MRAAVLLLGLLLLQPALGARGAWSVLLPGDVQRVAGSARDGQLALAARSDGVFASRDFGDTWARTAADPALAEALGIGPGAWYVAGRDAQGMPAVQVSLDDGATFATRELPLGAPGTARGLALDDQDARHAFAVAEGEPGSALFETRDAGASWRATLSLPVRIESVAWDDAARAPVVGTQLGVLGLAPQGWLPRSASLDVGGVAHGAGFLFATGTGMSIWRDDPPIPQLMVPWANPGNVLRLAPDAGTGGVMAALDTGVLMLCIGDGAGSFCKVRSPPGDAVRDAWQGPSGVRTLAASASGLWGFDR